MIEKRKTPRMAASYEVFVNHSGHTTVARARDVSLYGIGLFLSENLTPGETAELTIVLPEGALNITLQAVVRYCVTNSDPSLKPHPFLAGLEFKEESGAAASFLMSQGQPARYVVSHSLGINRGAATCYRLMCVFERYPEWAKPIEQVRVLERYPDGRGKRVEFVVNIFLRKARYVLDYSYDDQNCILSWVSVGGDFLNITGRYVFQALGETSTSATYELDVTMDFPLPQRLINYFSRIAMRKSMKDFKTFVEKETK